MGVTAHWLDDNFGTYKICLTVTSGAGLFLTLYPPETPSFLPVPILVTLVLHFCIKIKYLLSFVNPENGDFQCSSTKIFPWAHAI